jgi:hypothetical protein
MELSALEKKMGGLYAKLKGDVLLLEKKMGVDDAPAVDKRLEGVCAKLKDDVVSLESKLIGMDGRLGMLAVACKKLSEADVRCAGHLTELGAEMKGLAAERERAVADMRREASEAVSQRMGELEAMWKAVEARADKAMAELAHQTEDEQAVMRLTQAWGRQLIEANQNAQRENERREQAMAAMQAELRGEMQQLRDQAVADIRQELQKELRGEMQQLRDQAVAGMRQELQKELKEEVRQLRDQAVAAMRQELQKELRGELEQQAMLVRELLQQVTDMAGTMDGSANEVRGRVCGAGCDVLELEKRHSHFPPIPITANNLAWQGSEVEGEGENGDGQAEDLQATLCTQGKRRSCVWHLTAVESGKHKKNVLDAGRRACVVTTSHV